jgi:hypothetical protein
MSSYNIAKRKEKYTPVSAISTANLLAALKTVKRKHVAGVKQELLKRGVKADVIAAATK